MCYDLLLNVWPYISATGTDGDTKSKGNLLELD
jgi:hypothetical protein